MISKVLGLWAIMACSVGARRPPLVRHGVLPNGGKIWAVLVAGGRGYENYRHQANICHVYQILRTHDIPEERIITMMYDDIAESNENPTPGIIINEPDGPNVYEGVHIDYRGKDVNPEVFLAVLQGNSSAVRNNGTGRVLQSGPRDHVFVNFVDHGAPGVLCFPHELLIASQLHRTLRGLARNKKFSKMVWYVEACESGSMFDAILPTDMNIIAVTAADPREPSYACYYDETRHTYLGDVFSSKWMEDAEVEDLSKETIHDQYQLVRRETNTSHVQEYGDLDVGSMVLSLFLGDKKGTGNVPNGTNVPIADAVPSRDAPLQILYKKLKAAVKNGATESKKEIEFQIYRLRKYRRAADTIINHLVQLVAKGNRDLVEKILDKNWHLNARNRLCYEQSLEYFQEKCFKIPKNSYLGTHLYKIVNMCSTRKTHLKNIRAAMDEACKSNLIAGVV